MPTIAPAWPSRRGSAWRYSSSEARFCDVHLLGGAGRRAHAEPRRLRGDLAPDGALRGRAEVVPKPAQLGMRRPRRGREPARAVRPAALLDALRRDLQLRAGGDEDRALEHAVLLRADELLALVEEDAVPSGLETRSDSTEPASLTSVTVSPAAEASSRPT